MSINFPGRATTVSIMLGLAAALFHAPAAYAQESLKDGERILGTVLMGIGKTPYDDDWARLKKSHADLAQLAADIAPVDQPLQRIATVNRWVNRHIEYGEDIAVHGQADYWSDASTTLAIKKGDCEDYAILKMELLASIGIPRAAMAITILRDKILRRQHAVLIVKNGDGTLMLDNMTDKLLDGAGDYDYSPIISLGENQSWIHAIPLQP